MAPSLGAAAHDARRDHPGFTQRLRRRAADHLARVDRQHTALVDLDREAVHAARRRPVLFARDLGPEPIVARLVAGAVQPEVLDARVRAAAQVRTDLRQGADIERAAVAGLVDAVQEDPPTQDRAASRTHALPERRPGTPRRSAGRSSPRSAPRAFRRGPSSSARLPVGHSPPIASAAASMPHTTTPASRAFLSNSRRDSCPPRRPASSRRPMMSASEGPSPRRSSTDAPHISMDDITSNGIRRRGAASSRAFA